MGIDYKKKYLKYKNKYLEATKGGENGEKKRFGLEDGSGLKFGKGSKITLSRDPNLEQRVERLEKRVDVLEKDNR